ncbi:MAG: DUF4347 domain-containing protein, partial [Burkholderiales bacterium]
MSFLNWLKNLGRAKHGEESVATIEELEPRILYSGDLNPLAAPAPEAALQGDVRLMDQSAADAPPAALALASSQEERSREIVFVDARIPNAEQLVADITANAGTERTIEVILIDPSRDGILQINDALADQKDVAAIHIVSHGGPALLALGNTTLDAATLAARASELQAWSGALTDDADVLLYGCDVAQGAAGQAFIADLARLTGADIMANPESPQAAVAEGDSESNTATVRHEVVILDPGVQNFAALRDLLLAQQDAGRHLELFVLDADRDGVDQIAEILARYDDLDAVHVLSHGTAQGLQLGNTWLDAQTINSHADAIRNWQGAFGSDADLLLYGCDLASSDAGRSFVDTLGQWTGTDVAASTDLTGYALFGGDWDLEYRTGSIETADAADLETQRVWVGLMSVAVDTTSTGSGSSVNSVTVSHVTTSAGDRLMLVGVSMDATGGRTVTGVTYAGQNLTLVGAQTGGANPVRVEIWRLINPPSGTANAVVTLSGNADGISVGVTTFTGVHQTTPLGTFASAIGTSAAPSVNVTSAAGDLVYDVVAGKDATSLTQGAGQTELWEVANGSGDERGAASTEAGAATVTMSWSKTTSATAEWAIGGVSIKAAAPAGITVSASAGLLTTEAGGTASFTVVLDAAPTANVTMAVSSSDTSEGTVSTSLLTFTSANWSTPQTVTVTGVDDALADGYQGYSIVLAAATSSDGNYSGLNPSDAQAANSDNDITYGLITVDTTSDTSDGDTSSLTALAANRGADGVISLREAITAANNTSNGAGGADQIAFNIAGTGPHTIAVSSALPTITESLVIDGWSEPDFSTTPVIVLDGNATTGANGIHITASNVTVRGLVIQRFDSSGIYIQSGSGNTIQGNFIGTNAAGTALAEAAGSMAEGIQIRGANNLIGGTTAQQRNIIGGTQDAIRMRDASATGNVISGNHIGTGVLGTETLGNTDDGVDIGTSASGNTIGGSASGAGNRIANNSGDGIEFRSDAGSSNAILGNTIVANGGNGIDLNQDGVTANDAPGAMDGDSGANGLQNFPVLTNAVSTSAGTTIVGTFNSNANTTYRIEFFTNRPAVADSTNGEGDRYLGFATVTTDGSGNASFTTLLA